MRRRTVKVHGRNGNEKWRPVLALVAAGLSGACADDDVPLLRVAERIAVPDEISTLAIDAAGRMWLGQPGTVWVRDTSAYARSRPLPASSSPRIVGWIADRAYLRTGDSIYALSEHADTIAAARGDFGFNPVHVDVRGRALYQGARTGAVLAHDPETLEPFLAWPSLGEPTTAVGLSPQGDRLYQALGRDRDPHLLTRDLQTGRVLGRTDLDEPLEQLVTAPSGILYGLAIAGGRAVVIALRPEGTSAVELWRTGLPYDANGGGISLEISGSSLLVLGLGEQVGIRELNVADGTVIGRTENQPRDAVFGPGGALWALYPGEVRRLR